MITIITGEINAGKTRELISIYEGHRQKQGDGFAFRKIFHANTDFSGYEIIRLSTAEKMPLAYRSPYIPAGWDEIYRCGPFSFSRAAIIFAESIIDDIIDRGIGPIFIDEIGPLELQDKGFAAPLRKILPGGKDIYITVRNRCLQDVLNKFNIREHRLIEVKKGSADYRVFNSGE